MLVFAKYLVSISSSNYMPPDNRKRKQTFFPEVFYKTGVLKNFTKFTGKRLCKSLFFNRVADLEVVSTKL